MEYIGIDVHQRESQVGIVDDGGRVLIERRVRTRRERFAALLGAHAGARVLLEASTESEWVAHAVEGLGHEVIVRYSWMDGAAWTPNALEERKIRAR